MTLFTYWRSSASWRVRIALALKGIEVEQVAVHLRDNEQLGEDHTVRNPMRQVPVLQWEEDGQTRRLSQSLAILHYLEATHPTPSLLPDGAYGAARAWQLAEVVNAGIQPLQNLAVTRHLGEQGKAFAIHWIRTGLDALEAMAGTTAFLAGDGPSVADCCLVPQLYNARRFRLDASRWPTLTAIDARCAELAAFQAAHPDHQPDRF
jgi:maleylpyruvate isomerase